MISAVINNYGSIMKMLVLATALLLIVIAIILVFTIWDGIAVDLPIATPVGLQVRYSNKRYNHRDSLPTRDKSRAKRVGFFLS